MCLRGISPGTHHVAHLVLIGTVLLHGLSGIAAGAGPDPKSDRLEEYLSSLQMDTLLAEYLQGVMASASTERERVQAGERLARVYTRLLEGEGGDSATRRWESAAEELLRTVPDLDSLELRLALAQASYRRAERDAERSRLYLDQTIDRSLLVARFGGLLDRFAALAERADGLVQGLERRQEDRMTIAQRDLVDQTLQQARRHSSMAHYLAGYSGRYLAMLDPSSGGARRALLHFGRLLDAPSGEMPVLSRFQESSARYPHIARSAIGSGLCFALLGQTDEGLAWLDALAASGERPEGIDGPIFSARAEILSRSRRWDDLLSVVNQRRDRFGEGDGIRVLPTLEARLIGVLTLEAIGRGTPAPTLAMTRDLALSDLMARGEFGHAVDLASVFGGERFGVESFVSQQVRALLIYERARAEHAKVQEDDSRPVTDPDLARSYLDAARLFERALETEDAFAFPDAMSSAAALIGLCRYYAGAHSDRSGAEWFVRAADQASDPQRAAESLWMAILAMDAEIEALDDERARDRRNERDALIDRFLREHPLHPRADLLLLRRIADGRIPPEDAVELLLGISESSPMYDAARREAARLEFMQFRQAASDRRDWHARRFLELAGPLLAADERRARVGDAESGRRAIELGRRMLEAALRVESPEIARATSVMELLESLLIDAGVEGTELAEEFDFRRAQIALATGNREEASAVMERLIEGEGRFVEAASRLFYRDALARWRRLRRADAEAEAAVEAARDVVRHGGRLFVEYTAADQALTDPAVRSLGRTVADAALDVHLGTGRREWGERALVLYATLRDAGERDADLLRSLAVVAESLGDDETALESWRTLVAGLRVGSDEWFGARVEHLRVLSRIDPERARDVMAQHRALYPELGPEPHRTKLQEIERTLQSGAGGNG